MNELIRELAEQARIKDHWSIDEGRYLTNYLDEKKFAELIVRECAKIADIADENKCEWIGGNVLTHFGVAE
jgi:hypothetical protein